MHCGPLTQNFACTMAHPAAPPTRSANRCNEGQMAQFGNVTPVRYLKTAPADAHCRFESKLKSPCSHHGVALSQWHNEALNCPQNKTETKLH